MTEPAASVLRMDLAWRYAPGQAMARLLAGLRERRIEALACDGCGRRYLPPRPFCGDCRRRLARWVAVRDEGTLEAFSVVHLPIRDGRTGEPRSVPYGMGLVRLDGADTTLNHYLSPADAARLAIGQRVRAVWREDRRGALDDILCFEALSERLRPLRDADRPAVAGPGGLVAFALLAERDDEVELLALLSERPGAEAVLVDAVVHRAIARGVHRVVASSTEGDAPAHRPEVLFARGGEQPPIADPAPPGALLESGVALEFRYAAGRTGSAFLAGLGDGRILGSPCRACSRILCPARSFCPRCGEDTAEPVAVGPAATLVSWTDVPGKGVFGLVRLDGADTGMLHRLLGVGPFSIGARVRARFAAARTGRITGLEGFELGEARP